MGAPWSVVEPAARRPATTIAPSGPAYTPAPRGGSVTPATWYPERSTATATAGGRAPSRPPAAVATSPISTRTAPPRPASLGTRRSLRTGCGLPTGSGSRCTLDAPDPSVLYVAAELRGQPDGQRPVVHRQLVPALGTVQDTGAVAERQLGHEPAARVGTSFLKGARLAQLRLQRRPAGEERLQRASPALQERWVDIAGEPLPRVGDLPQGRECVLVDVLRYRPPDGRQPAAEVVQQTEADAAHGLRSQWPRCRPLHHRWARRPPGPG